MRATALYLVLFVYMNDGSGLATAGWTSISTVPPRSTTRPSVFLSPPGAPPYPFVSPASTYPSGISNVRSIRLKTCHSFSTLDSPLSDRQIVTLLLISLDLILDPLLSLCYHDCYTCPLDPVCTGRMA